MRLIKYIILVLLALSFAVKSGAYDRQSSEVSGRLIIFHAGSLSVPFRKVCAEFGKRHPGVKIFREAAGSRMCARKISDLHRACDVMASADYTVIDTLLIDEHADWNIKFAGNEMVIAFDKNGRDRGRLNRSNWYEVLVDKGVTFGRSDPNSDPCGYRTVLTMKLAEKYYGKKGLAAKLAAKDRRYMRPKEVDLLALLETGLLDYMFIYRSVAQQHGLGYVTLPDEINLKKMELADAYGSACVRLTGKKPGTFITRKGAPIVYGVTIPKNAPNRKAATAFLEFLLDADTGGAILARNGQTPIVPAPTKTFDKLPAGLKKFALPVNRVTKKGAGEK